MKFYLIGDYPLLGSKSMEKYPVLIKNIFKNKINFQILKPKIFFNKINFKCLFLRKWLGYLDNYILFGIFLFFKIKKDDLVHICNQSNSLLFPFLKSKKNNFNLS